MSSLVKWLIREQKPVISVDEEQEIIASIACLSEMVQSVSNTIGMNTLPEEDNSNLALTAALLAELTKELNSLLQKPPKTELSVTHFN